jgi:hypothetical protein
MDEKISNEMNASINRLVKFIGHGGKGTDGDEQQLEHDEGSHQGDDKECEGTYGYTGR